VLHDVVVTAMAAVCLMPAAGVSQSKSIVIGGGCAAPCTCPPTSAISPQAAQDFARLLEAERKIG
jgi:hypothetical protein